MELLGQTKFGIRVMTIDDYEKVYSLWMSCKNMGFNNLDDSREWASTIWMIRGKELQNI